MMKSHNLQITAIFILICFLQLTLQPADSSEAALQFAVYPSTQKVFPDTVPEGNPSAELTGARGEYQSFQIALRSATDALHSLSFDIPGFDIFEVYYIQTPEVARWGYPEEYPEHRRPVYPDPLVPVTDIHLMADETRSLWVRGRLDEEVTGYVHVGDYRIPVSVHVWDFEMPMVPSLRTAIGLGGRGFARYYQVDFNSEEFWRLYAKYYEALLEYRLSAYRVPYGLDDERSEPYLTDERVTTFILDYYRNPDQMKALWDRLTALGVAHKGWFLNLDEPETMEEYIVARNQIEHIRTVLPDYQYALTFFTGLKDLSTPFDHLAGWVNLWVVQTDYYHHGHGLGNMVRQKARERWEAGDEIWLYTALAPRGGWCNILLNHTALEHRLLFWQVYAEEIANGYIYWQSTYWDQVEDPWTDQATVKMLDAGVWGDGSLFYPGEEGPIGSIRLELIREGLQDFELLKMAEAKFGREKVMEKVSRLTKSLVEYTDDPLLFEQVRREIGWMLEKEKRSEPQMNTD